MSFIMIAAGPASSSRIRMLSFRWLLAAGGSAAVLMLAAGAGLGRWAWAPAASAAAPLVQQSPPPTLPSTFSAEQLGALSGRLFKLESQAGQLIERIGVMQEATSTDKPKVRSKSAGSGGPMLPPRPEPLTELGTLQTRVVDLEHRLTLAADAAALHNLALLRMPSRLPLADAEMVSSFGNREDPLTGRRAFHAGLDFAADKGTAIHAAAGGTVAYAGFRSDFGWVVEISHGNGLTTRYAHASRLLVKTGALVMPGDTIAAVGSTGRSTGPHLHFEVLRHGEAADPRLYLAGL